MHDISMEEFKKSVSLHSSDFVRKYRRLLCKNKLAGVSRCTLIILRSFSVSAKAMGIHGLSKVLGDYAPSSLKENDIKNYFGWYF